MDPKDAPKQDANTADLKALRDDYDRLAGEVAKTAPNSPERFRVMEEKRVAFQKYTDAQRAQERVNRADPTKVNHPIELDPNVRGPVTPPATPAAPANPASAASPVLPAGRRSAPAIAQPAGGKTE